MPEARPLPAKYGKRRKGAHATIVEEAEFREVIGLILSGCTSKRQISKRCGINHHKVQRICEDPRFRAMLADAADKFYSDHLAIIKDRKLNPIIREMALKDQAFHLAAETVESARDLLAQRKAAGRTPTSAELRVGIEAYATIFDRSPDVRNEKSNQAQVHVHTFIPNAEQAQTFRDAEAEAGLDMSDIILDITPEVDDAANADDPGNGAASAPDRVDTAGERDEPPPPPADPNPGSKLCQRILEAR